MEEAKLPALIISSGGRRRGLGPQGRPRSHPLLSLKSSLQSCTANTTASVWFSVCVCVFVGFSCSINSIYRWSSLIQTYKYTTAALLHHRRRCSPVDVHSLWNSIQGGQARKSSIFLCSIDLDFFPVGDFFLLILFFFLNIFYRISYLSTTKEVSEEYLTELSPSTCVTLVTWKKERRGQYEQ